MISSPPASRGKPAIALLVVALAATLSACGSSTPDIDEKLQRAELAAQRATDAQKAAESALARMELIENSQQADQARDAQAREEQMADNAEAEASPTPGA